MSEVAGAPPRRVPPGMTASRTDGRARLLQAIRSDPLNPLGYVQYGLSYAGPEAYERIHRWYKWFLRYSA